MRRFLPLLVVLSTLAPWGVAVAQDGGVDPTTAFGSIATASPTVAVAFAFVYGAYQLGQIVAKVVAAGESVLEKGIPIRIELTDRDRDFLSQLMRPGPRAVG